MCGCTPVGNKGGVDLVMDSEDRDFFGSSICPVCKAALMFIWLRKGGKYSSFDKHRQFLPVEHPFRVDEKNFMKGVVVTDPAPEMMTCAAVHAQMEALVVEEGGTRFVGYGEEHAWSNKVMPHG